jgi:hypothetical protein
VPAIAWLSQTVTPSASKNCCIASSGTPAGQYLRFLISAQPNKPFLRSSMMPLSTQKPELRTMYLTVWKYDCSMWSSSPTIFLCCENCFKIWGGVSFPSTNSITNMMFDNTQQAVWYSFPNGCSLRGQNIQPGHVHLLCQIDIESSRKMTHAHRNLPAVWSFQDLIIW